MSWRPNELFWARALADELGWWERWRWARALRRSPELRQEHARRLAEKAAFDADPARADEVAALLARLPRAAAPAAPVRAWRWAYIGAPALAAAALALFFWLRPAADTLTAKGGDLFVLHARGDGGSAPLGSVCHPGQALRGQYRTAHRFLLVVEQDPTGAVQVLHPMGGDRSVALGAGEGLTPGSWILDQTPGEERFVALFSDRPLSLAEVAAALAAAGSQRPSLDGVVVVEQRCHKEGP